MPPDAARHRPYPCPRGRFVPSRAAHGLLPAHALRSQKSLDRPPGRNTRYRHSRPHSLRTLYTTPTAGTILKQIPLRKWFPVTMTVAVRTVQSFPIHGLAPSCHRVFARGGTINRKCALSITATEGHYQIALRFDFESNPPSRLRYAPLSTKPVSLATRLSALRPFGKSTISASLTGATGRGDTTDPWLSMMART